MPCIEERRMINLSLVIPAHNSEKVIKKSVETYYSFFSNKVDKMEIIAVCNGCNDHTVLICNELKKEFPLKVVEIPQKGKGYALIEGFNISQYEIVGFLDADNPFDLNKIMKMINLLDRADVVIASKYLRQQLRFQDSLLRRIISICGGVVSKVLFNLDVSDTQAGAKFFKKKVWEKISQKKIICRGFDFDIEFLYKSKKAQFRIMEFYVPLEKYVGFSTFRLKYLPGMLKRLIKLRFLG